MFIPFADGTYTRKFSSNRDKLHDIAFNLTNITGGVLTIRARKPGATFFEDIPDGIVDLSTPTSVTFNGAVAEYEFTLAGATGSASRLIITDTSTGGD